MSPVPMELTNIMYTPSQEAPLRQKPGSNKHRKSLSTGGGRAWSDSEVCS